VIDREAALRSQGANVVGQDGDKIGTVQDIYLDDQTNEPEWALVSAGTIGGRGNFVPLSDATMEGNELRVPYTKDKVQGAPSVDPDGQLSPQEERELYEYYEREYAGYAGAGYTEGTDVGALERERAGTTDYDTTQTRRDDAMTRSEEELHVGTEQREAGRARLRKYVVTEDVQTTVPVQREEVRVEREPITDANVDAATSGPDISEAEHEVVLTEEQPVVEKRTVPKERVRLEKDTVTDEQQVAEEVRKEQIETEGDTSTRTDPNR
jgi:uncharacterized protein (TIGR02271 family)